MVEKEKIFKHQLLLYPTGPNVTRFLVEPPWAEGIKICTNPQGHMTNMATMPIHVKSLYKMPYFGTCICQNLIIVVIASPLCTEGHIFF